MSQDVTSADPAAPEMQLEQGTYEILRNRLQQQAADLRRRLDDLNEDRRQVFGTIETALLATERITTENNCVARDMFTVGDRFLFGYNVHFGLKSETELSDVFAVHRFDGEMFHSESLDLIDDATFLSDFRQLYKYYKHTVFSSFHFKAPFLYMVFRVGKSDNDIKAFKWRKEGDRLLYVDARSDHEVTQPKQHSFEWVRTHRDLHRTGLHPHVSIEDRVFVEAVGGDITVKVEDNTDRGEGIYAEPVDDPDQTLDDAEIFYAIIDQLILIKIRPYQEAKFRYLVFSEKLQSVSRIDSIEHSCVLLPEGHGIVFPNGYFLQTGEHKAFDTELQGLRFHSRIASPNGEDYLFVFHNTGSGDYVLLSYNLIEQRIDTPVVCHGFASFDDGKMLHFKVGAEPQKHHAIQIWQTPYVGESFTPHTNTESMLYKIGNKDLVRGMAECHEVMALAERDDSYEGLYLDLVKKSGDIVDSYFWINEAEVHALGEVLIGIRSTATAAVEEFEKVARVRRQTQETFDSVSTQHRELSRDISLRRFDTIGDYVDTLAELRHLRGEIIGLKELRYIDTAEVEKLEEETVLQTERSSHHCVQFLLGEGALKPYIESVEEKRSAIEAVTKVAEAKQIESDLSQISDQLEMLIDVVSNLKIDDATQRTSIIEEISSIYSQLNQARATVKKREKELLLVEGEAEFHSQLKLLSQSLVNYLDVCDTPERCDEYLTKLMVQVEELEGRFAEFDDFVLQLAEKRDEIYSAFDGRRVSLIETRNKRATTLLSAGDRILKGIETRVRAMDDVSDIHSFFAADMMVEKVRDIVNELTELGDSVKVDDLQSRLKTVREDAIRQLKDRQELYLDGENVIQLGRHRFSVNTQELDLTTVIKDDRMMLHLAGTNFLQPIEDAELQSLGDVWAQSVVSENHEVYRGEYLAYQALKAMDMDRASTLTGLLSADEQERLAVIQAFMAPRHQESYVKGVHDHDASIILGALLDLRNELQLLRFPAQARILAQLFWNAPAHHPAVENASGEADAVSLSHARLERRIETQKHVEATFGTRAERQMLTAAVVAAMKEFVEQPPVAALEFSTSLVELASQFLLEVMLSGKTFPIRETALQMVRRFEETMRRQSAWPTWEEQRDAASGQFGLDVWLVARSWMSAFHEAHGDNGDQDSIDEAALALSAGDWLQRPVLHGQDQRLLERLVGDHPRLRGDVYTLAYANFMERLHHFEQDVVPRYRRYTERKKQVVEEARTALRLQEFKPRVLSSFVRNRLIDEVYLPIVGDNLAKQMGVVGEEKRTDLMGLLLLISPPGYGKTTLMEYIANRLGLTFMKINGPAIGHQVVSLDPAEAPNASAREEVEKLNLSLEMGDNVMIYLDDIQHCHPEFLQKFISLCDAQRKIEGVYRGRPRTYDLRGKKVAVVMAGNPYTESGQKFQIPDMLSNRADTYNLGEIIGDSSDAFEMSYIENAMTSNPILAHLANRSRHDIYGIVKFARQGDLEGIQLEGKYSSEELSEYAAVLSKLMRARDVVLAVNKEYIRSAAQADEYRTEPPFKLQGSYRDMNKIAERIVPIMNDEELSQLIDGHYQNQAQTLTSGAEANLLKLKEIRGSLSDEAAQRWLDIKKTFQRNLLLGTGDDSTAKLLGQLNLFGEALQGIQATLATGVDQWSAAGQSENTSSVQDAAIAGSVVEQLQQSLSAIESTVAAAAKEVSTNRQHEIEVTYKVPKAFLEVIRSQFSVMQAWLEPIAQLIENSPERGEMLANRVDEAFQKYQRLLERLETATPEERDESVE